ncbi:STU1 [Colletotrichum abscissum]|uniref:STU1 n=1 Tax=Colletotrichum abscissum TaxID=1671311 RepID=A0A9P9XBC9_9PEZI|nr:STU1 [Colletotrichum abscissum]KAI3545115.1 STU1 [Colletotrichum abscissum]KAK1492880.1 STU1 [Colletotrichum abscissum]
MAWMDEAGHFREESPRDANSKPQWGHDSIASECPVTPAPETRSEVELSYANARRELDDIFREKMMYFEGRESEQNWLKREESMTKLRSFEIAKNKALELPNSALASFNRCEHELNTIEKINEVLRESREDLEPLQPTSSGTPFQGSYLEAPEPLAALGPDLSPISPDSGDSEDSEPSEQGAQPATLAASSFSLSAAIEIFTVQWQNETYLVKGHVLSYPQWLRKLKTVQPVAAIKPNNLDYAVEIIAAAATLSQSHICNLLNDVSFPESSHAMLCGKAQHTTRHSVTDATSTPIS